MTDVILTPTEQLALGHLMAAEPVPGSPFPDRRTLEHVCRLIPCDALGVGLADHTGLLVDAVTLPHEDHHGEDPQVCDGPLWLGVVHVSRLPDDAEDLASHGLVDELWLGVRNGVDHVAQLYLDRRSHTFSERDLAMLHLVAPTLQRLMRERPTPHLPDCLTLQERRVLTDVAAGRSNAEIAAARFIARSTVRKHLEHTYRKLGVTNRVAAVAVLQQRDAPGLDLQERINRFA